MYHYAFLGTELTYRFRTFVLMDFAPITSQQPDRLFGWVLEVALQDTDFRNRNDQQRLALTLEMIRRLFRQGVKKQKIRHLLDFISAYLPFEKSSFLHKFDHTPRVLIIPYKTQWVEIGIEEEIQQITKSRTTMVIREAILNEVEEQGFEKGIEQKERIVESRAWKKGMSAEEIAELADMPVQEVEVLIRELEQQSGENE